MKCKNVMAVLQNLKKEVKKMPTWFFVLGIFLSLVGSVNASYLTYEHFKYQSTGSDMVCYVHIMGDCNDVLQSKYSEIFNVPVALLGLGYYLFVLSLLVFIYFTKNKTKSFFLLSLITAVGFLFGLILVYLQLFVLEAVCPYCMLSALISVLLFGIDYIYFIKLKTSGYVKKHEEKLPALGN